MPARRLLLASTLLLATGLAAPAAAQTPSTAPGRADAGDDVTALENEIARDDAALSSQGCAVACQAFSSMQRAAERLCALDPGPRCAAVRAKVKDAAGRVSASCPECGIGGSESPPDVARQGGAGRADEESQPAPNSPAPSRRGGGCAGCNVGDAGQGGAGTITLALAWALARAIRRRRRDVP